ncbi:MAG: hypothetical protein EBU81_09535, partial [Proteobacteria bacterium]|nr:hypothetical protein [Pseudomonadota bacterium]
MLPKSVRTALALLAGVLVACARVATPPTLGPGEPMSNQVPPLVGKVDMASFAPVRQTQASIGKEIAVRATVSLIDTQTGFSVATTVTDTNGAFKLVFSGGFTPTAGTIYVLDAIKGL